MVWGELSTELTEGDFVVTDNFGFQEIVLMLNFEFLEVIDNRSQVFRDAGSLDL